MSWFRPRDLLDQTFEVGIILKGLDGVLEIPCFTAQVRALVEEVGDLAAALPSADPAQRALLYQELGISGLDQPVSRMVIVTADPGLVGVVYGGAIGTLRLPGFTTSLAR